MSLIGDLMRLPSKPLLNETLTKSDRPVLLMDVVQVTQGQTVRLEFLASASDWRQGVWLGTHGILEVNGAEATQFVFWEDTSPPTSHVHVVASDGLLRLCNVWDRVIGLGHHESQSVTSGMVKRIREDGSFLYNCNDTGFHPKFDKLTFVICRYGEEGVRS